ncbi:MAG: OmpH family outer membrane protein [Pyrinomonadaceae bacterium]
MKKFGFIAVAVLFLSAFGMNVIGQTAPATPVVAKVAWIDTSAFDDDKTGILKFVNAYKALANEAKPRETELVNIQTRVQTLSDELQKMQSNPAVPVDQKVALSKKDEGERLAREYEFKKKEYDAFIQKRGGEIIGPVNQDIGKAIEDFAKAKGYTMVFDIVKMAQTGVILHFDGSANVTKDFIAFYNARQTGAATAAAPK